MSIETIPPLPVLDIIEGPDYYTGSEPGAGWVSPHRAYRLRLTHEGRTMETPWRQGMGIATDPEPHDVIGALVMDAQGIESCTGFPDWAKQYGYDPDSIRDRGIYDECRRQYDAVNELLGRRVVRALMDDENATYGAAPRFALAWTAAFAEVTA
jgi:hypothetical protein